MTLGILLVVLSGVMAGSVLTPLRLMRHYRFENTWLVYTLAGTVVLPWLLAAGSVSDLAGLYGQLPLRTLMLPPLFALCWGLASAMSGLCVTTIGVSLTYALVIGGGAVTGAIVPMLYFTPERMTSPSGFVVLSGVLLMIAGIALVGIAGRRKELALQAQAADTESSAAAGAGAPRLRFLRGAAMALVAGALSAGLNFAFAFGQAVSDAALLQGASAATATYPLWSLAMIGGAIPNAGIAIAGCARNGSWPLFARSPRDLLISVLMGALFIGSTVVYGIGALRLGTFGTSAGWGIMQVVQIVVGAATGYWLGEWAIADRRPVRLMAAGVALLGLASAVMAYGNYLDVPR